MIAAIAQRLGIPEADARILYDQWLEQVTMTLNDGKPVVVRGLGAFNIQKGVLVFQADPELALFSNRLYAGLEVLGEEELAPNTENIDLEMDGPLAEILHRKKIPAPRKKAAVDVGAAPKPEIADIKADSPEDFEETIMEPVKEADATEKKNLTAWIIAIPVVVVVMIAAWYGARHLMSSMEARMASKQADATAAASAAPVEADTAAPTESPLAAPEYGLRGPLNPLQGRVYAIIVHSLPARADSQAECAKISAAGLRCSVVETQRNGRTTYRVAIGQFATNENALTATSELPAEYAAADKHFIARIQ